VFTPDTVPRGAARPMRRLALRCVAAPQIRCEHNFTQLICNILLFRRHAITFITLYLIHENHNSLYVID